MTAMTGGTIEDLMAEIARLAPSKKHHLSKDMVNGKSRLTLAAARMVLENLTACPDIMPAQQPRQESHRVSQDQGRLPTMSAYKDVPAGYYATPPKDGSDAIDYWKIEKGKEGTRWDGYTFARRVLGGFTPDDKKLRTIQIDNIQQRKALQAITELGLEESQELFVSTLERCIDCSAHLTNGESRARKRGPDCQKNFERKN